MKMRMKIPTHLWYCVGENVQFLIDGNPKCLKSEAAINLTKRSSLTETKN